MYAFPSSFLPSVLLVHIGMSIVLCDNWTPALTLSHLLLHIYQLLANEPDGVDPLNYEAGRMYRTNRERYNDIARQHTVMFANPAVEAIDAAAAAAAPTTPPAPTAAAVGQEAGVDNDSVATVTCE